MHRLLKGTEKFTDDELKDLAVGRYHRILQTTAITPTFMQKMTQVASVIIADVFDPESKWEEQGAVQLTGQHLMYRQILVEQFIGLIGDSSKQHSQNSPSEVLPQASEGAVVETKEVSNG